MRDYLTSILPLEIEMGVQERITTVISTKGQVILFDGFLKLYEEGTDDEEEKEGEVTLPMIAK